MMKKVGTTGFYIGAAIIITALIASAQLLIEQSKEAYAASNSESSCVSDSGASDVQSVKQACSLCFNSGKKSARGTLWFNSSSSERNSDVVKVSDPNATTANIFLWGQTYSCGEYPTTSTAYHIWFGRAGKDTNYSTEAVPYLVPNDASKSKYRGSGGGYSYTWLSLEAPQAGWSIKVQDFKNDPDTKKTITSSGLERYEATVSVNRCYNNSKNGISYYSKSRGDCYGEDSKIVLEIPAADNSGFSSKSRVTDGSKTNESSNWGVDDAGTLEIEADASGNATVYFAHNLQYKNTAPDGKAYNEASTTGTITFDDGSGDTYDVPFSAPGDSNSTESGWQTSDAGIEKNITLASGEDEKTICSTITYTTKTVNWSNGDPHVAQPVGDSGSTKACAKITRSATQPAGQIEFWSQSRVESVAANDVKSHYAETIEKTTGDVASLRLSTDWPSAKANFSHKISYEITGFTVNANDTVDYTNMCTKWEIEADTSADGKTDKFCASSYYTGESTVNTTTNHTVNISSPGSQGTAQEKIKYEKKVVPILKKEIKYSCPTLSNPNKMCSYNPKRWNYYAEAGTGSGKGDSAAKIIYDRPTEPGGNGPSSGNGSVDGSPMYAGETSTMAWDASANPIDTRRVMEYQSIAFLAQVSKSLSSANTKGTYQNTVPGSNYPYREGYSKDPCTFWRDRLGPLRDAAGGCVQVTSKDFLNQVFSPDGTTSSSAAGVSGEESMAVPDWVGDKYCNSFGYQWEYYYGVMNTKGSNAGTWTWTRDNQSYWVHYNAACRTIAKKPSVALWNGGLFVGNGNVKTSTASRYHNPSVGTAASAASDRRQYGSWAEYLANVNGGIGGNTIIIPGIVDAKGLFASGAAYAWNGSTETDNLKNSPLTIQNVDSAMLGFSGVATNSALMDRLDAYFKAAKTHGESSIGSINVSDTRIYYVEGDVNITGPITISSSAHSVYQIPQVVIFATGNINIAPGVERIDAWLISQNGIVDTCAGVALADGVTQASVYGPNPDTRPTSCNNKLVINGPVLANSVITNRTYGSDGTSNSDNDTTNANNPRAVPAEVFNLSAENYLWAYAQAGRYSSSYTEAYSRELPPRY